MDTRLKTDFGYLNRDEFKKEAQKRISILHTHAQALWALLSIIDRFEGKPVTKRIANALAEKVNAESIPASTYYSTEWNKAILISALTPEGRHDNADKYGERITLFETSNGTFDTQKTRLGIQNRLLYANGEDMELHKAAEKFDEYAEMTGAILRAISEYKKNCPRVLRNNKISEIYIPA